MNIDYQKESLKNDQFNLITDQDGRLIELVNPKDDRKMNWVKNNRETKWGEITTRLPVDVKVIRKFNDKGNLIETYQFTNNTDVDMYSQNDCISLTFTTPDYYVDNGLNLGQRCHTHLWCGGTSSYLMNLRMDGTGMNLGIVTHKGGIQSYSIRRDFTQMSNERGDFLLHPMDFHLYPGETYELSFEYFWFDKVSDFFARLESDNKYIFIKSQSFILFEDEEWRPEVKIDPNAKKIHVQLDGQELNFNKQEPDKIVISSKCLNVGEHLLLITVDDKITWAKFLVKSQLKKLASKRVDFIVKNQQNHDDKSHLNGDYLIFDNELKKQFYSKRFDQNGGRERVGMGVLIAHYLRNNPDKKLKTSLLEYSKFLERELVNKKTGEVYNDVNQNNSFFRLYNYPWVINFYLEMFLLMKEKHYLNMMILVLRYYYQIDGASHYSIGIPMIEIIDTLKEESMIQEADEFLADFKKQGDFINKCGINYPKSEVNFEQSIVAPAAIYLIELYALTKEKKYLEGAKQQLRVLKAFIGYQPDFHLYHNSIRHWDGYWFGKHKLYGDTFPHYWSSLTGIAFKEANEFIDNQEYLDYGKHELRGVLSLFFEDGSASCAMVYPLDINKIPANYFDPWSNDQDWGLYYAIKYL